ncbi:MAG: LCP family protein [Oscillospiraceae bacterium]|nr:LCP family protein [Oscillospiraceae bacterium]
MKVFGGNGRRENNSGNGAQPRKNDSAGRNNINNVNRGNNNSGVPRKNGAPKQPKKKNKGKGWLIALLVILLIAISAIAYWKISTKPPEKPDNQSDPSATQAVERYYTLLVVGIDQGKTSTDTIMVVRYDTLENKANIVSIPRDTLLNVPSEYKKINSVYTAAENKDENGIDALMDAVEGVCGFRPNNYVCIDTKVFVQAIDKLGGVFFDVPIDMNYDDYTDWENDGVVDYVFTIHVQKGYQLLNGDNALGVFRFRHNNDGSGYPMQDLGRIETQHGLIKAVASQALQLKNVTKLVEIAKLVLDSSETDLSLSNMQWYAQEFMKMSMDGISFATMPVTGSYINGFSYVTVNVDDWIKIVNDNINPFDEPITAQNCNILCQKNQEPGNFVITPGNYSTTNGGEVYTDFPKNTN